MTWSVRSLLVLLWCTPSLFSAAGIKDVRAICASPGSAAATINVYFGSPVPAGAAGSNPSNWRIRYFYTTGFVYDAPVTSPIGITTLPGSVRADITIGMVPAGATSVLIQYSGPVGGSSWIVTFPCPAYGTVNSRYKAATGKDDADIYISGGYSPATATTPTFSTDVNLAVRAQISGSTSWQLTGAMKTDNRAKADPDSFRFRGAMVYDAGSAWALSVNGGLGMEFDRKGRARNVVASPRFSFVPISGVRQSGGKLLASAAL